MASFAHSHPSRKPSYLGASLAVGAALAVAGFVVGTDGADTQPRDEISPRDAVVAEAVVSPVAAPRVDQARFPQRIPAELLMLPLSVTTTLPLPPDAQATRSTPGEAPVRVVIPTPRKRPAQDTRAAESPPPAAASAQIARIKTALRLTPEQERYWPPVEAALRDIVTQVGHETVQSRSLASGRTAVDPERVQRLTSAAMPLLMTFDEAQKREVRRIARNMGLDNVASAI
jgi:hypothetical protein